MISVVVPVLNGMPWLEEQLEALACQQCDEPWEVVVADNGSTDGSVDVARRFAASDPRFFVVDASARRGAPAARNAGVRRARGDRLLFCDADDLVQAGWVQSFSRALEKSDVVGGVFDFGSLNGRPGSDVRPATVDQLGFLPAGLGANLAVRREPFEAVQGFSEDMAVGEDIDLCWRLQLAGFRFAIEPGARVAKRGRHEFRAVFRQAISYGSSGPALYRRFRHNGARRALGSAARSWVWLLVRLPSVLRSTTREQWAWAAGVRSGRLVGSLRERVFFP